MKENNEIKLKNDVLIDDLNWCFHLVEKFTKWKLLNHQHIVDYVLVSHWVVVALDAGPF